MKDVLNLYFHPFNHFVLFGAMILNGSLFIISFISVKITSYIFWEKEYVKKCSKLLTYYE